MVGRYRIAMGICLFTMGFVQGLLYLAKGVISGIAAAVIAILEAAIKAMGPHFFKINMLMIEAGYDALEGLKVWFGFEIDMWLLWAHIGPWGFHIEFTVGKLTGQLWDKVKSGLRL